MLLRALRFIGGALAGFLFWWYATPIYNGVTASGAAQILQLDKRLCGPRTQTVDRNVFVSPRLCVAPTATVPADQLTYNIILLAALFAMRGRFLPFIAACTVVMVTHVLSLAVSIESTYARTMRIYSSFEQNLWVGTEFFWRLVGMFAIVFACWWLSEQPRAARKSR